MELIFIVLLFIGALALLSGGGRGSDAGITTIAVAPPVTSPSPVPQLFGVLILILIAALVLGLNLF